MASKESRRVPALTNWELRRAGPGVSGYVEGKAAKEWLLGCQARRSAKKRGPPLSPTPFRYAPQLRAQRRESPSSETGSKLDADTGSIFDADRQAAPELAAFCLIANAAVEARA